MSLVDVVNVREVKPTDIPFIVNSTTQCLSQYTNTFFKGWEYPDIKKFLEASLLSILPDLDWTTFVACDRNEEDRIFAYVVANPKLNYIYSQYTKYTFRRLGIQNQLLLPLVVDLDTVVNVHWQTNEMLKLLNKRKVKINNLLIGDNYVKS